MKKLMLAAGGLLLATANTPPPAGSPGAKPEGELSSVVAAEAPKPAKAAKPAKEAKPHRMAAAPADPQPAAYPRCSSSVRDRCVQGRTAVAHRPAHRDRGMQLAMRAGERG